VILHHDIIHNPTIAFHFELQWIGTTAKIIEERVREWGTRLKPYGLRVAEAYVTQISDIRDHYHFRSCSHIRLCVPPPVVSDLEKKLGYYVPSKRYFESAILRKFGFILDTEASNMYPQDVELVHSYRRSHYDYAQFVHRSGVAFAQVLGGEKGFLILANSLRGLGRMYRSLGSVLAAARSITLNVSAFCSDEEALSAFYREELEEIENASPLIF
jgi:DEP domain-containing protein 5